MKVWEYLDFFARCYGIPAGQPAADDRRPPRPRRPRRQARRLRPGPLARHAAAAVPRPHARPRPAGPAPRRAGLRPRSASPGRAARAPPRAAIAGQDDRHQQPHPSRARGAVHERRDRRPRPGARPGPGRRHRAAPPGTAPSFASGSSARRMPSRPPGRTSRPRPASPRRRCSTTARSSSGSAATMPSRPSSWRRRSRAGIRVVSFARAASDLEELFLQVTSGSSARGRRVTELGRWPATTPGPAEVPRPAPMLVGVDPGRLAGVSAIWVRELRGRMRGKRAFIFLTFYLGLLTTLPVAGPSDDRGAVPGLVGPRVDRASGGASSAACSSSRRSSSSGSPLPTRPGRSARAREADVRPPRRDADLVARDRASASSSAACRISRSSCSRPFPIACLAFVFGGIGPEDFVRGYVVLVAQRVSASGPSESGARPRCPGPRRRRSPPSS